jgi:uroporphyrinogen-III synthase
MARIVVTRAEPGASATAERLTALGHTALLAPMLTIAPIAAPAALDGFQAVVFTSSNGARAFAAQTTRRDLPVFCVGDATAEAARAAGFSAIHSAGGDLVDLIALVAAKADRAMGPMVHAAGADLAGDLAGALRTQGFAVEVRSYYKAVQSTSLPDVLEAALNESPPDVDAVLFHSARAAAAFVNQVKHHSALARIDAVCLSDAVADAARAALWRSVTVAGQPQEEALLLLLPGADSGQG